jgi:hypothetical protein
MTYKVRYDWLQAGQHRQEFLLSLPESQTGSAVHCVSCTVFPMGKNDHVVNLTNHLHLKWGKGKNEHLSLQQQHPLCVVPPPTLNSCHMYCGFPPVSKLSFCFLSSSICADGKE